MKPQYWSRIVLLLVLMILNQSCSSGFKGSSDGSSDSAQQSPSSGPTPSPTLPTTTTTTTPLSTTTTTMPSGGPLFGLTIPTNHPRLWFNDSRLSTARTWYQSHPFSPRSDDYQDLALKALLSNNAATCSSPISWAISESAGMQTSGVACDDCRWSGESIILIYDWCYNYMSSAQRSTLLSSINNWVTHWSTQSWGGTGMVQNNYFWGYLRNELEWAIATYEDNTSTAQTLLADVYTKRLANDFNPASSGAGACVGGVGLEGPQYGPYLEYYATVPWGTSTLYGNDLFASTDYWKATVYGNIYSTTPALTTSSRSGSGWDFTPFSDTETWNDGNSAKSSTVADYMAAAAMRWSGSKIAGHARQWLQMTGASAEYHIQSIDPGGLARSFTELPLDYFASGASYLWGHSSWNQPATMFFIQMNTPTAGNNGDMLGHAHQDRGTFQIWRNGRWLSRETPEYSVTITGYGGTGTTGIDQPVAHNDLLINGAGPQSSRGSTPAKRLESQPEYAYADVDLTKAYGSSAVHAEREYVFVRSLETMVILDRIQSSSATATKTFLAHCETPWAVNSTQVATCTNGTQALQMTMLLPSNPDFHIVAEKVANSTAGQSRMEANTTPGTAQSYILTVLQARDASATGLSPSVQDNGTSYVVSLSPTVKITFVKGMSSSAGSILINGATKAFRSDVQKMIVTEDGPAWQ